MHLYSKNQLGLHSSEVLTRAGGSTSKVAYPHGWQVSGCFWQDISVLPHENYFIGLLKCLHNMEAGFLQKKQSNKQQRSFSVIHDLTSETTYYHFSKFYRLPGQPYLIWEGSTQGPGYQEVKIIGHHLGDWQSNINIALSALGMKIKGPGGPRSQIIPGTMLSPLNQWHQDHLSPEIILLLLEILISIYTNLIKYIKQL